MTWLRSRHRRLCLATTAITALVVLLLIGSSPDSSSTDFISTLHNHLKTREAAGNIQNSKLLAQVLDSAGDHSITSIKGDELIKILAQESKCPACFGHDLCEEVTTQYIALSSVDPVAISATMMSFPAKMASVQDLTIKVPRPDILGSFDQLVCPDNKLKKWTSKCHSMIDAENPFLLTPQQFIGHASVSSFRQKLSLLPTSPDILACPSLKHKNVLVEAYDANEDSKLSIEERNWLHTGLTVAPEVVAHKVALKMGLDKCLPELLGVCGRVAVVKGAMTGLSLWLDKSFSKRASLAVSLLSRIEDFVTDSGSWVLFERNWSMDNLQVDHRGEVFLASAATVSFLEKTQAPSDLPEKCDWRCVNSLVVKISSPKGYCITPEEAMHVMYSHACAMVLSDMAQHKFTDYFTTAASQRLAFRQFPGLLHGVPAQDRAKLEILLSSCVDESEAGERLNAVEEIQDLLADILGDDDASDEQTQEDADEDDSYEERVLQKSET